MSRVATIELCRPQPRPCMVVIGKEEKRALFHGFSMKSWTHGAAASIGGFSAGQESFATAVIELDSGRLAEVPVVNVTMLDSKYEFSCYDFTFDSISDAIDWNKEGGE